MQGTGHGGAEGISSGGVKTRVHLECSRKQPMRGQRQGGVNDVHNRVHNKRSRDAKETPAELWHPVRKLYALAQGADLEVAGVQRHIGSQQPK